VVHWAGTAERTTYPAGEQIRVEISQ